MAEQNVPFEETLTDTQKATLAQGKQYKSTADQAFKAGDYKGGASRILQLAINAYFEGGLYDCLRLALMNYHLVR